MITKRTLCSDKVDDFEYANGDLEIKMNLELKNGKEKAEEYVRAHYYS